MKLMKRTHIEAEKRYGEIRKQAIQFAQSELDNQNQNLRLSTITPEALRATRLWETSKNRRVDWDWIEGYTAFKAKYPKRFEVALWQQNELISISQGRPTQNGANLRLDVVESRPKDLGDRPSTIGIILLSYSIYGRLLGAKEVRIMNPVNNDVKMYYEQFGYKYVVDGDYLFKELL